MSGQTVTRCPKGSWRWDGTYEKKGNARGDSSIFGLSHREDRAAGTRDKEDCSCEGRSGLRCWTHVQPEKPIRQPWGVTPAEQLHKRSRRLRSLGWSQNLRVALIYVLWSFQHFLRTESRGACTALWKGEVIFSISCS